MAAFERPIDTISTTRPTQQGAPHHRHRPYPSADPPFCRFCFPTPALYTDLWLLDDHLRRIRKNLTKIERRSEEKSITRFVRVSVLTFHLNLEKDVRLKLS